MEKKILVVGGGISGISACDLLIHLGKHFVVYDDFLEEEKWREKWAKTHDFPAPLLVKEIDYSEVEQIVLSPGVPLTHRICQEGREHSIEITGEAELAMKLAEGKVIGITGTNGKSTVVSIITHVLNKAGIPAVSLGNIGKPLAAYFCHPKKEEVLVLELSSFQLETLESAKLDCAMIVNITPDHLDHHASFADYAAAKLSIAHRRKKGAPLFVDQKIKEQYCEDISDVVSIGAKEHLIEDVPREGIWKLDLMRKNLLASFLVVEQFGISLAQFISLARDFPSLPHRLEYVGKIGERSVYNDSKGTTPEATVAAVHSVENPVTLLVGGLDKGLSFAVWKKEFVGKVDQVIAFGRAAEKIVEEIEKSVEVKRVDTLQEALDLASFEGKGSVVLSPGCASFDQFDNYIHRGEVFVKLIEQIAHNKAEV